MKKQYKVSRKNLIGGLSGAMLNKTGTVPPQRERGKLSQLLKFLKNH